jgi:hypothetical protein
MTSFVVETHALDTAYPSSARSFYDCKCQQQIWIFNDGSAILGTVLSYYSSRSNRTPPHHSAGYVGIGTSSVNALLEVNNSTAGGEVQRIEGNYDGSGSVTLTNWRRAGGSVAAALKYNDDSSPLCMSIGTTTSHEFRIRTADTDAITIDASQRVGIGVSAPGAILDVAPDANRNLQVQGRSGTTYGLEIKNGTANSAGEFHVTAASSGSVVINRGTTEIARFTSTGLGIGTTSPLTKFVASNGGAEGIS